MDVLGLGAVAIDDLLYVQAYPPADAKVRVAGSARAGGGLTANALVAAARLGASCAYAGVLGTDEWSGYALGWLQDEGVDMSLTIRREEARPIRSTVIVDETTKSRTIFFNLNGVVGAHPDWPDEEAIASAKVLLIDGIGMAGMLRAAAVAAKAGVPIVADLEDDRSPGFEELLALADHPILSYEFAARLTRESDPALALRKLWSPRRDTVVITCGAAGGWYATKGATEPVPYPAFRVRAVDTTGCGDVFHGAYAAALATGMNVEQRIRRAAAAAALKAMRGGGSDGIPHAAEVERWINGRTEGGSGWTGEDER